MSPHNLHSTASSNGRTPLIQCSPHSFCSLGHFSSLLSFQRKSVFWVSSPAFAFLPTASVWLDCIYFHTLQIHNSTLASHPFIQTHLSSDYLAGLSNAACPSQTSSDCFFCLPMLTVTSDPPRYSGQKPPESSSIPLFYLSPTSQLDTNYYSSELLFPSWSLVPFAVRASLLNTEQRPLTAPPGCPTPCLHPLLASSLAIGTAKESVSSSP